MLYYSIIFLIVAVVSAVFGFGGIAAAATDIAVLLFYIFIILFAVSVVIGLVKGRKPPM
ncbi:MAG: DUF1328 domain-containing protein [Magnetococcales bacterium]|nr:DUF1328 domain-containing protein [Magnetococcales bacterium]MEC8067139.1 DUF1328 domain-containing protein [Pseudomonadota bacterium]